MEKKKEHYVPQCYLRRFSVDGKFFVFDKEKNEKRPGNVENYACEKGFYDVDFEEIKKEQLEEQPDFVFDPSVDNISKSIDPQYIENFFAQVVETDLFKPISKAITSYTMLNRKKMDIIDVFRENEMDVFSLYLSYQVMRSKEFREAMTEMYEQLPLFLMKKYSKSHKELELLNSLELKIKSKNIQKLDHAVFIMNPDNIEEVAESFRRKIWILGYNRSTTMLYTSDNPVVKYANAERTGFNSYGIEIFFPLNPYLILILKDPEYFWDDSIFHNHFCEIDEEEVAFYNSLQVSQSFRYIFDKKGHFELVDALLKTNPELREINRKRFTMI